MDTPSIEIAGSESLSVLLWREFLECQWSTGSGVLVVDNGTCIPVLVRCTSAYACYPQPTTLTGTTVPGIRRVLVQHSGYRVLIL